MPDGVSSMNSETKPQLSKTDIFHSTLPEGLKGKELLGEYKKAALEHKIEVGGGAPTLKPFPDWKKAFDAGAGVTLDSDFAEKIWDTGKKWMKDRVGVVRGMAPTDINVLQVSQDIETLSKQRFGTEQDAYGDAVKLRGLLVNAALETGVIPATAEEDTTLALQRLAASGVASAGGVPVDPELQLTRVLDTLVPDGTGAFAGIKQVWRDSVAINVTHRLIQKEQAVRRSLQMVDVASEKEMNDLARIVEAETLIHTSEYDKAVDAVAENILRYKQIGPQKADYDAAVSARNEAMTGEDDRLRRQQLGVTEQDVRIIDRGTEDELRDWIKNELALLPYKRNAALAGQKLSYLTSRLGRMKGRKEYQTELMYYAEDRQELNELAGLYSAAESADDFETAAKQFIAGMKIVFGPEKADRTRRMSKGVARFDLLESDPVLLDKYLYANSGDEIYGNWEDPVTHKWMYKDGKNTQQTIRDQMMDKFGMDEVEVNTLLNLYDVTLRRASVAAYHGKYQPTKIKKPDFLFFKGEEIVLQKNEKTGEILPGQVGPKDEVIAGEYTQKDKRWKYRGGVNFEKLLRMGVYRSDKTKISAVVAADYNLGLGDLTMMFDDQTLKGIGAKRDKDHGLSAVSLGATDFGDLDWTRATKHGGRVVSEYMDYLTKGLSAMKAQDNWIGKKDWSSFGSVYGAYKQLFSAQFWIDKDGVAITDEERAQKEGLRSLRQYFVIEFAKKTLWLQNEARLRGMRSKVESYSKDKLSLIDDFNKAIFESGVPEADESEREFRKKVLDILDVEADFLKVELTPTEKRELSERENSAILQTLLDMADNVASVKLTNIRSK